MSKQRKAKRLLRKARVCQLAGGISTRTLDRWCASGTFPKPILVGGPKWWLDEVEDFLAARTAARDISAGGF